MRYCPTAQGVVRVAVLLLIIVAVIACGSSGGNADDWLQRAQQLTIDATKAHTRVLEGAGSIYKAEASRCTELSTDGANRVDAATLNVCMRPANSGRDKIEATATVYRTAAIGVLESSSWADVLLRLPAMRDAAASLARAFGDSGGDARSAETWLIAPIQTAEQYGGDQ